MLFIFVIQESFPILLVLNLKNPARPSTYSGSSLDSCSLWSHHFTSFFSYVFIFFYLFINIVADCISFITNYLNRSIFIAIFCYFLCWNTWIWCVYALDHLYILDIMKVLRSCKELFLLMKHLSWGINCCICMRPYWMEIVRMQLRQRSTLSTYH